MQSPILKFVKRNCCPAAGKGPSRTTPDYLGLPQTPTRTEKFRPGQAGPVECSFNLPFNSTFVSGVEFLIMHTPDPSQSGLGTGTETGAGLGVGVGAVAGIGSGQPSVSIEYAGQARLRRSLHCKLCTHTYTHTQGKGESSLTPSHTHIHSHTQRSRSTQFGRSPVEGSQPTSRCSGARAQRFKFSSLNNILFWRPGSGRG